jgi:uncharacterized DUF497 family protein
MGELRFEWDPAKDAANQRKHGIAFAEVGLSATLRILVVVHCYREEDHVIRLISARKATRPERSQYTARWQP